MLPKDVHDALEGKPFWNVVASPQHLAELGSTQVELGELLFISDISSHIPLLLSVGNVEGGDGLHTQLGCVLGCELLSIIGSVKVLARDRRLASSHIAPDDEVSTAVVLPDNHMLDGLTRASHMHRVGEVSPSKLGVGNLVLEHLVGLVADCAGDIVILRWAAGRVDEADSILADIGSVEGADEELVVSPVDGVAALESEDVGVLGELCTDLRGCLARENPLWDLHALHLSTHVVLSTLHGHHLYRRVLQARGAIDLEALDWLVGGPLALNCHDGNVLTLVGHKDLVTHHNIFTISVKDHGDTKEEAVLEPHVGDDGIVVLLLHEARQGGEGTHSQELDITGISVRGLKSLVGGFEEEAVGDGIGLEVDQRAAVGGLEAIYCGRRGSCLSLRHDSEANRDGGPSDAGDATASILVILTSLMIEE